MHERGGSGVTDGPDLHREQDIAPDGRLEGPEGRIASWICVSRMDPTSETANRA